MKISILGNGLTSLTLAKMLANQNVKVDVYSDKNTKKNNKIQTLGISKTNIEFFNDKILNIEKYVWDIKKIEIYTENLTKGKVLDFENNNERLFSIIKNFKLYNYLFSNLKKDKLVNFKGKVNYQKLVKNNYDLIFNCDYLSSISKKFFYKKMNKNYRSYAHVTTFKHNKILNDKAIQIFTKKGPIAFLPISQTETSIVYSVRGEKNVNLNALIMKYNTKYKVLKLNKFLSFELKASNLRTYYHKNIIAFGDLLHRLHPMAGQGFNMNIRDMKEIYNLIEFKKEHGLNLDISICSDFEKNVKYKNYLFANGIDFIYELFNLESKINDDRLSKSVKFLGKNKIFNKFFTKFADNGIVI